MNIESITIRNFKSIKDEIIINPKEKFNILLGLNGAGKSNVLQAIEILNGWNSSYKYSDYINNELDDEKQNIFIKMTILDYSLSKNIEIVKQIITNSLHANIRQKAQIYSNSEFNSLKTKLVDSIIDVLKSKGEISFIFDKNQKDNVLYRSILVDNEKILQIFKAYKEFLNSQQIQDNEIWVSINEDKIKIPFLIENNFEALIDIKFWKHEPKYLINDVYLKEFFSNPKEKSIALKNCLEFCKKDPYKILDICKNSKGISSLQESMNKEINNFLELAWPDFFNKKRLYFLPSENKLSFSVKSLINNVHLNADEQSDGYKQFLSILFSIGFDKNLSNTLLLIDEPEIHLHPSSVLQLRKMLKILTKKDNVLIAATHSIQMIDRSNLNECIFVEDNNGKTDINQEIISLKTMPNIIKQTFGVDIFSNFMFRKNVIFVEGNSDRIILKKLLESKEIDFWIFVCHGDNALYFVQNIKEMYPIGYWEKNCFAIFDSDESGKKLKQKTSEILNKNNVFTLDELLIDLSDLPCQSIEALYDEQMYNEFLVQKGKTKKKDEIKKIKIEFAENFVDKHKNDSFNEKTKSFLNNLLSKLIK